MFHIGLARYGCGEIDSATNVFEKILKQNENHIKTLFRLGLLHVQRDSSHSEALNYLTRAHHLAPHRSEILYERGEVHYKMGHLHASIDDKRSALQLERMDTDLVKLKDYYEVKYASFSTD